MQNDKPAPDADSRAEDGDEQPPDGSTAPDDGDPPDEQPSADRTPGPKTDSDSKRRRWVRV